jgi:hypothetical protein
VTRKLIFAISLSIALTTPAAGQLAPAARAAANRIDVNQIKRDLNFLSADQLKGRATFTAGFDSAAHYIAGRLKRAGLEPFGDNGTYFQYYDVASHSPDTTRLAVTMGGRRLVHGEVLVQAGERLPLQLDAPVVYVGHGVRIPSRGIDPYAGKELRGKILLVRAGVVPDGLPPNQPYPSDAEFYPRIATQLGAVAVMVIAAPRQLQNWDAMRKRGSAWQDLRPDVPSAYSSGGDPTVIIIKPGTIDTLQPGTVALDIPIGKQETLRGYNVVARLRGGDARLRDQYVTVAAHLDGAVIAGYAVAGDSIYNAADDNASGSAGILAVAEQLARAPRPKRSVVFIWDSGEEIGLYGTRAFVGRKTIPPKDIVAHFNVDMIGATRRPGSADSAAADVTGPNEVFITGPRVLSASMDTLLQRVNRAYLNLRLDYKLDDANNEFFYPRTDAGPFLERGVMTVEFFTGIHARYHSPQDEAQHVDPHKIAQISRTLLAVLYAVANADTPPRIDKGIPASVPRYE